MNKKIKTEPTAAPIDFVVTWVDPGDAAWQQERAKYAPGNRNAGNRTAGNRNAGSQSTEKTTANMQYENRDNRFRDWDLMRYWFRGVETFAPWVNRVYFVTCGQAPEWLNKDHPKLRLVDHKDYIPQEHLPTFNSNVIELYMHRIPGLSEQFVLFNDDMFLTAPTTPEDFFENGKPKDSALLDAITANDKGNLLAFFQVNNFSLINEHFVKKKVLQKNRSKFFTPIYGKDLLRNMLLCSFQYFSCFRDSHLPSSHLKSNFEKIWELEGDALEAGGMNRFRSRTDYSHWLMKAWMICEGNFVPRSTKWGKHIELHEEMNPKRFITGGKYKTICLNDSSMDVDFNRLQSQLKKSFETLLPQKCSFEL